MQNEESTPNGHHADRIPEEEIEAISAAAIHEDALEQPESVARPAPIPPDGAGDQAPGIVDGTENGAPVQLDGAGASAQADGAANGVSTTSHEPVVESAREKEVRREKVGKATFAITAFHMTGRIMGLVENMLVSRFFGGGNVAGAYFAASKVPWGIFGFGEQLLTHSFLPPFVEAREKSGEERAWRLASLVATVQILLLLVVVGLSMVFAPRIVGLYTRHFDAATLDLTTSLVRIMLPAVILMSVASLTYVILNAYKQFALPAFGDTALKAGVVIAGAALYHFIGIKAFAAGLILGAVAKILVHLFGLRSWLPRVRWTLDFSDPAAKKLILLMLPLMMGNILSSVRPLLDTRFSGPAKEVAALNFAFKLTNLPFFLVPYALSIALFPFLAEMATRNDKKQIGRALVSALRMVTFLLVPVTAVYIMLALPLVQTVYGGGLFTDADATRVVAPLVWYSVGMIPIAIETVVLQIFFAMSDTKTPTVIAYGTFVVYLGVASGLCQWLTWGAAGVALAIMVSKLVKDVILLGILTPRLEGLDLRGVGSFLARLAAATAVLCAVLWATLRIGYHAPSTGATPPASASESASPDDTSDATPTPSPASTPAAATGPAAATVGTGAAPATAVPVPATTPSAPAAVATPVTSAPGTVPAASTPAAATVPTASTRATAAPSTAAPPSAPASSTTGAAAVPADSSGTDAMPVPVPTPASGVDAAPVPVPTPASGTDAMPVPVPTPASGIVRTAAPVPTNSMPAGAPARVPAASTTDAAPVPVNSGQDAMPVPVTSAPDAPPVPVTSTPDATPVPVTSAPVPAGTAGPVPGTASGAVTPGAGLAAASTAVTTPVPATSGPGAATPATATATTAAPAPATSTAGAAPAAATSTTATSATPAAASAPGTSGGHSASSSSTPKPKKKKGASKMAGVKVFVLCATPGIAAFLLVAHWLRIEEFLTLYAVLVRRLAPLLAKLVRMAMEPW